MFEWIKKLLGGEEAPDYQALLKEGALLLDVRTPGEFRSGALPKAQNIPLQELDQRIKQIKKKNRPVVAYCQSGRRSGMAVKLLRRQGVEAYNGGGIGMLRRRLS